MFRSLRNSFRFYSIKLIVYELMVCLVNIVAFVICQPFKRTWTGFDIIMVWLWAYHWDKPIWSWSFLGYYVLVLAASLILEKFADGLWDGD